MGARTESLYNAFLHDKSISLCVSVILNAVTYLFCAADGNMVGKSALPNLSKSTSADDNWKGLPLEEQERLLQQLRDSKAKKAEQKTVKVTHALTANDIEGTMLRLNAEVSVFIQGNLYHLIPSRLRACPTMTAVTYSTSSRAHMLPTASHRGRLRHRKSRRHVLRSSSTRPKRSASRLMRSSPPA